MHLQIVCLCSGFTKNEEKWRNKYSQINTPNEWYPIKFTTFLTFTKHLQKNGSTIRDKVFYSTILLHTANQFAFEDIVRTYENSCSYEFVNKGSHFIYSIWSQKVAEG